MAKLLPITDDPALYSEVQDAKGMWISGSISDAGGAALGGGFLRFDDDAECLDWTLSYEEFVHILEGELAIETDEETIILTPGMSCLIASGSTVNYRGKRGTRGIYVLWPRDWVTEAHKC